MPITHIHSVHISDMSITEIQKQAMEMFGRELTPPEIARVIETECRIAITAMVRSRNLIHYDFQRADTSE